LRYAFLIPALDEAETLPALLERVRVTSGSDLARVVVVDNGSTDDTPAIAQRAGASVVSEPRPGYGRACQSGIHALRSEPPDVLVFLDADDFQAPAQVERLLAPLRAGEADLVVGERQSSAGGGVRWHARLGNRLILTFMRGLYGAAPRDMGPFRAIRWVDLERLRLDDPDFGWYVQMQVRAVRAHLRTVGIPVTFERRSLGRSKVSGSVRGSLTAGWVMLRTLAAEVLRAPPERAGRFTESG
jgi:glycosyltransferase involved in cell wall biosynthesis